MKAHEILSAAISVMSMTGLRRRCPGWSLCTGSYDDHDVRDFLYSALITVFVQNTETNVPFYSDVLYVFVSVVSMTAFSRIVLWPNFVLHALDASSTLLGPEALWSGTIIQDPGKLLDPCISVSSTAHYTFTFFV
jgi:hypothetical protein